jgi:hypothetical protein
MTEKKNLFDEFCRWAGREYNFRLYYNILSIIQLSYVPYITCTPELIINIFVLYHQESVLVYNGDFIILGLIYDTTRVYTPSWFLEINHSIAFHTKINI